jgi:hypothetical protein
MPTTVRPFALELMPSSLQSLKGLSPLYVSGQAGGEDGTAWLAGEVRQYSEFKR